MMFVLFRAGCVAPYAWLTGEERLAEASTSNALDERAMFNLALDSLFQNYDHEVLNMLLPDTTGTAVWVDSMMSELTVDEKIGQLFIINLSWASRRRQEETMRAVERHHVGGFIVSRAVEPGDLYEQTSTLQEASKTPLFFAADYERGVGQVSNNLTEWPSNMGLGATRDPLFAAAAGRLTAMEGRAVGVNMVLAPVVDVNNNPQNPIINIRSYGEDPQLVGLMATSFVQGAQELGMHTTLKHFPGHGNTSVDTHTRMGTISGDRNSLDEIELYPYRVVFNERIKPSAVMSAHLWTPAFDQEPLPATFSRNVLHHLLRDTLRFDGLIVTDDLKMGALEEDYTLAERTLNPLLAGADIVLTKGDFQRSIGAVKEAVDNGEVSEAALDRSVRRILEAKAQAGLHKRRSVAKPVLDYLLALPRGEALAQAAADKAVTLLKNETMLPLKADQKIALIQLTNTRNSESIGAAMDLFAETLGATVSISEGRLESRFSNSEKREVTEAVEEADGIVIALYLRLRSGRGEAGLYPEQDEVLKALVDLDKPVTLITLGNPYAVNDYAESEALLVAYEQSLASVRSMSRVMLGEHYPSGRLPSRSAILHMAVAWIISSLKPSLLPISDSLKGN